MDSPRAKKKVIRAPAVSASFGSTNLMRGGQYLVEDNYWGDGVVWNKPQWCLQEHLLQHFLLYSNYIQYFTLLFYIWAVTKFVLAADDVIVHPGTAAVDSCLPSWC